MAIERIDHRTYTPQGQTWDDAARQQFFGQVQKGQAVDGRQGYTWQHDGSGWTQTDEGTPAAPGAGGGTNQPQAPGPGGGPTTPPGTPQRPSALPPSPPPAAAPPQIPLGSTRQTPNTIGTVRTAPGLTEMPQAPGTPGRVTGPGLIDASQQTVPTTDGVNAAFKARLLELLEQNPTSVSTTDPAVAAQSQAFRAAAERSALKNRAGLMEQASAQGIADTEATRAQGRAIEQQTGQAIGANDAALIGQEIQARRGLLQQALDMANQQGMQQEANDLQRQIANLDAVLKSRGLDLTQSAQTLERDLATLDVNAKQYLADLDAQLRREGYSTQERLAQLDAKIREMGITSQQTLGTLELALRDKLGTGELNLGFLSTLLQNQQVNNKLGFDIGQWQSILNRDSLLAAMGG
jgi:hypothetical protein